MPTFDRERLIVLYGGAASSIVNLRAVLMACLLLSACGAKTDRARLRLGYMPNVTHAPALTGVGSGRLAAALGATRLETRTFNAGPAIISALLGNALDAAYVGPGPALSGFLRTRGRGLRVVAGAASGGASFVVREAAQIRGPEDLHGRTLATPQLGNTQDVALRRYLQAHGLRTSDRGGDVQITPMENPNILNLFRAGSLDGAWVPEPWATRLVREGGGRVFLDERDLWPGRRFASTVLVARMQYLRDAGENVEALVRAHAAEVTWLRQNPAAGQATFNTAIAQIIGRPLPEATLASAWERLEFTTDPMPDTLAETARAAQELGFLPRGDARRIIDEARARRAAAMSR